MIRLNTVRWLALPVVAVALSSHLFAQQQGQLYLSVLDAQGNPVKDLTVDEISVTTDGVESKVLKVEPFGKPTRLSIMIDNGPVTSKDMSILRNAYKALLEAVPEEIQVEILTTAPQPRWLEKPTTDRQKLLQSLDRLTPDSGAGLFFDALTEAANRVDKDKGAYFPVFLMLATDFGRNSGAMDREYTRLQQRIQQYGITVHFLMFHGGGERLGSVAGGVQTETGLALTKLSGGRYENINAATRLPSLLPEFVKSLAASNLRQMNEMRVTYEIPGKNAKPAQQIGAGLKTTRTGLHPQLSLDGHMPAP
jgi:hypothetical protein